MRWWVVIKKRASQSSSYFASFYLLSWRIHISVELLINHCESVSWLEASYIGSPMRQIAHFNLLIKLTVEQTFSLFLAVWFNLPQRIIVMHFDSARVKFCIILRLILIEATVNQDSLLEQASAILASFKEFCWAKMSKFSIFKLWAMWEIEL